MNLLLIHMLIHSHHFRDHPSNALNSYFGKIGRLFPVHLKFHKVKVKVSKVEEVRKSQCKMRNELTAHSHAHSQPPFP
jgi:hypothetical protein